MPPIYCCLPSFADAKLTAEIERPAKGMEEAAEIRAYANDGRMIASAKSSFPSDETSAKAVFNLPVELANEIDRLEIAGQHNAGATLLLDNRWRRKPVGVVSVSGSTQSLLRRHAPI